MILLVAVIIGLLASSLRAWYGRHYLSLPSLRLAWLVLAAFVPQWFAFYLPATHELISDKLASAALVGSQLLLLVFALLNRKHPGFWALALGLACNLLVIILNGGLMPISPETVTQLDTDAYAMGLQAGQRLGTSKDVVLEASATQLVWLSDRFLLPTWFPYRAAFSIGDVLIAAGAFWLMWALGGEPEPKTGEKEE